jgi:hypothetical protein
LLYESLIYLFNLWGKNECKTWREKKRRREMDWQKNKTNLFSGKS